MSEPETTATTPTALIEEPEVIDWRAVDEDPFDPEGDDADEGCPPDVLAVLGFDPDEEDQESMNAYAQAES